MCWDFGVRGVRLIAQGVVCWGLRWFVGVGTWRAAKAIDVGIHGETGHRNKKKIKKTGDAPLEELLHVLDGLDVLV